MMEQEQLDRLKTLIAQSGRIAFLGGAGLSTESGIPDFRSENGVFKAMEEFGYPPEVLLSHSFFTRHTDTFYAYYRKYLLYPDAKPNRAHQTLARMEKDGKLTAVITQNIDNLHQAAGSKAVLELHGSVYRNYCLKCGKPCSMESILHSQGVPRCGCGGVIRPDVVLYEEPLDQAIVSGAVSRLRQADLLLIGGTSLVVYPAAGLVDYFGGKHIVVINLSETGRDGEADLVIHERIGEALAAAYPE